MPAPLPIGTVRIYGDGYAKVKMPNGKWESEHRVIAQATKGELVHHDNEQRADNRPRNLQKMSRSKHTSIHNARRPLLTRWSKKSDCCISCGTSDEPHSAKEMCFACWQRSDAKKQGHWPRRRKMIEPCRDCGRTGLSFGAEGRCCVCRDKVYRDRKRGRPLGTWARKYDACVQCSTTDSPHKGGGLCRVCYGRRDPRYVSRRPERYCR